MHCCETCLARWSVWSVLSALLLFTSHWASSAPLISLRSSGKHMPAHVVNLFLIHLVLSIIRSIKWTYVVSRAHPAGWPARLPAVLCSKNFTIGHYTQTFQLNLFISAILILTGTIGFYHVLPHSLTFTLPGDHKLSAKAKPIGFIFLHTLSDQDEI